MKVQLLFAILYALVVHPIPLPSPEAADGAREIRGWDWEVGAGVKTEDRKRDDAVETNVKRGDGDATETNVKKGFITVDVVSEDTNQTPAFDVRSEENSCLTCMKRDIVGVEYQTPTFDVVSTMKEGERGVCASCLRDSDVEEQEEVFVHWSKREAEAEIMAKKGWDTDIPDHEIDDLDRWIQGRGTISARNDWNTDIPDHEVDDLDRWIQGRHIGNGDKRDIVDDEVNDLDNWINSQHDWSKRMERANAKAKGPVPDWDKRDEGGISEFME